MNIRVITISRQVGTAGEEVARAVAERFGFRYVDYQIVQAAAREAGVMPETVSEAERTPSLLRRLLESMARTPSAPLAGWTDPVPLVVSPLYTSADYRALIESVIRDLAETGDAVLVGHVAQIVLSGRSDTLNVFITGSPAFRTRRVVAGMGVDEKSALKTIERTDSERQEFFQRFYNTNWLAPWVYDLCISTDHIAPAQAAELVELAARRSGS